MSLHYLIPSILQCVGVLVPLIGCIVLFQKEQSRGSMSLLLTNAGCLIMNCSYLLLLSAKTPEAAHSALKMEYVGNSLFYFLFMAFLVIYLKFQHRRVISIVGFIWVAMDAVLLISLWSDDKYRMVFEKLQFEWRGNIGLTFLQASMGTMSMIRYGFLCVILLCTLTYTLIKMFQMKKISERNNLAKLAGAQFMIGISMVIMLVWKPPYDIVPVFASLSILSIVLGVIKGDFFSVADRGREWVIQYTGDVFIVADHKYGYLESNPCAGKVFPELEELSKNEPLPDHIKKLFAEDDKMLQLGEHHYTKKVACIGNDKKIEGYGLLLIDISQQFALMEQLELEKERAEEANIAKSTFMSNMSHEIRTPMNAIVGMTDILLREELPPHQREYLNNIKSSGNALLTIINDILDFSKIESGKMEIIEEEYEPMSMFHDLSMIFLNRIGEKQVELIYDIDTEMPMKLFGDSQRIRQVIINIMNNAIKFTEQGYVKLQVKTRITEQNKAELFFSIEDTGQGIRKEDMGKLFGSFQRVDTKKNRYKEGTGLGLAISRQLVELMGGTIDVQSEYGKGSTFYFTIVQGVRSDKKAADLKKQPAEAHFIGARFESEFLQQQYQDLVSVYGVTHLELADAVREGKHPEVFFTDDSRLLSVEEQQKLKEWNTTLCILQNPMQQDLSEEQAVLLNKPLYSLNFCQAINHEMMSVENEKDDFMNFTASEARILIVDDNEMNLKVAIGLLEPLKLLIDTAPNGKKAFEMVQKKQYHMVFMDHMMPIMDGMEATKKIRELEDECYRRLPIVALSANATTDARESFSQNGFSDFVAKPIKMKTLCKCIRRWLPKELVTEKNELQGNTKIQEEESLLIEGLNVAEGIENSGSKELFLHLLGDFYKLIDQKTTKIQKCLADGMLRDYTIEVHALKSTARMIGAMELSEQFYHLEQLGNAGEQEQLEAETPKTLALYRSYKPILEIYGKRQEEEKQKVSVDEMIHCLEQLRDAMDQFDLDGADAAMQRLETYAFPEKCQNKVQELSAYVADVAMEEVMQLAQELISELNME